MYRVRVLIDGFVMGTTAHPKGSEISVSLPIYNYLTAERKVELVEETGSPEPYHRRDMQAETQQTAPAQPAIRNRAKVAREAPPPPPRPKAKAKPRSKAKAKPKA